LVSGREQVDGDPPYGPKGHILLTSRVDHPPRLGDRIGQWYDDREAGVRGRATQEIIRR
jgi:hypothetical protein